MDIGKIPPNDIEAEQAVLGSMLTDKDAVIAAIEVLKEEDFYREDNKIIYRAILNLYNHLKSIQPHHQFELNQIRILNPNALFEYIRAYDIQSPELF